MSRKNTAPFAIWALLEFSFGFLQGYEERKSLLRPNCFVQQKDKFQTPDTNAQSLQKVPMGE